MNNNKKTIGHAGQPFVLKTTSKGFKWSSVEYFTLLFPYPPPAAVDAVSTRESPRRKLKWKQQVSHPSLRFTMAILEKTIRPFKQWGLCKPARVSFWLFFPCTCEITVNVRAGKVFPYSIVAGCALWKRRADRCWQKAWDNTCLNTLKELSVRVFITYSAGKVVNGLFALCDLA